MNKKLRLLSLAGLVVVSGWLLTGCDFEREDPADLYDDVGEIDLEARERLWAARNAEKQEGAAPTQLQALRRHAHEVGEMSLDDNTYRRPAPENRQPQKAAPKESKDTSAAPARVTPVPRPVASVPAPAPAPEYRAPRATRATRATRAVNAARVTATAPSPDRYVHHHATNVGEIELGY